MINIAGYLFNNRPGGENPHSTVEQQCMPSNGTRGPPPDKSVAYSPPTTAGIKRQAVDRPAMSTSKSSTLPHQCSQKTIAGFSAIDMNPGSNKIQSRSRLHLHCLCLIKRFTPAIRKLGSDCNRTLPLQMEMHGLSTSAPCGTAGPWVHSHFNCIGILNRPQGYKHRVEWPRAHQAEQAPASHVVHGSYTLHKGLEILQIRAQNHMLWCGANAGMDAGGALADTPCNLPWDAPMGTRTGNKIEEGRESLHRS